MKKRIIKVFIAFVFILSIAIPITACNPADEGTISINLTSANMVLYDTLQLTAELTGADETITWESSDESKATVNNGLVTALAVGEVKITAKAGKLAVDCIITITDEGYVPKMSLSQDNINLEIGDTFPLNAQIELYKGHYISGSYDVAWNVTDQTIINLEAQSGTTAAILTALKAGSTKVSASSTVYGIYCYQEITVNVINSNIIFNLNGVEKVNNTYVINLYTIAEGGNDTTYDLGSRLTVYENDQLSEYSVTWQSSDENIVTVNENGLITAHKAGDATVLALCQGNMLGVNVKVNRPQITVNQQPYAISLFDKAANQADNNVFKFKSGDTLSYINENYDEVINEIKINNTVVSTEQVQVTKNQPVQIYIDYSLFTSNIKSDLGQKNISFETDLAIWVYKINVYTQILETKEDVQNWLNVSVGLSYLSNNKPNGYFALGGNITSADYWTYTPYAMGGGAAESYNSWNALFTNNNRNFKGFEGIFDGKGYYIEKMNIQTYEGDGEDYTAFIPTIAAGGEVRNIAFSDCRYTIATNTNNRGGFISACNAGIIKDVYIDVEVIRNVGSTAKLGHWGALVAFASSSAQTERCIIVADKGASVELEYGAGAIATAVFHTVPGVVSNIFSISTTITKQIHYPFEVLILPDSQHFTSATAMKDAAGTHNYSENFTNTIWAIDANGLPYFASFGSTPYSYS